MSKMIAIRWPNECILEIQVRERLCDYKWKHSPPADSELPEKFIKFRNELCAIHGLEKADIGRHDITLERYEVFEWDELVEQVLPVISAYTGAQYEVTWVDRRNTYRSDFDGNPFDRGEDYLDTAAE